MSLRRLDTLRCKRARDRHIIPAPGNGAIFLQDLSARSSITSRGRRHGFCSARRSDQRDSRLVGDRSEGAARRRASTDAFGSLVFNDEVQQTRLPKPVYHALRRTMTHGEPLDAVGRRRGRVGDEGVGRRARRHALHALVPAAHRHHRRKARFVSARRPATARRSLEFSGKELITRRARRVELSVGRHALHLRGARLHGVGSDQPAVAAEERQRDRRWSSRRRS